MSNTQRHEYARHRLFVAEGLGAGQAVSLDRAAANYLFNVLRMGVGDGILLFNGRDGEWAAQIEQAGKRAGVARVGKQVRAQDTGPDLWLLFAPLKKDRTDFVIEKAVEMGVSQISPIFTQFTNARRVKLERMEAQVIEACEQCERLTIPHVGAAQTLEAVLADWPTDRALIFASERAPAGGVLPVLAPTHGKAAILIGPEGGFSEMETQRILAVPNCHPISLGPRILRADTAAVAALALWQAQCGDWA